MHKLITWQRVSCILVMTALLATPTGVQAKGFAPDCYVLAVGVDNYPRANKLKGCVNDARSIASQFATQQSKRFGKVTTRVLTDGEATRVAVGRDLDWLSRSGSPGDYAVLLLSGHGSPPRQGRWNFLTYDFDPLRPAQTTLSDREILRHAHALADRGLTVVIIVDACFAGQLRRTAADLLNHYRKPGGGGLILMLSSMPSQTSAAMGPYSAFARAVVEGLSGAADVDGDGFVTLREVRRYAYHRTYQLLQQKGISAPQDGECDWSLSIREDLRLTVASPQLVLSSPKPSALVGTVWVGSEDLPGFGKLIFRLQKGDRAVMEDARETIEGTWQCTGSKVTLRFDEGRVVYEGTLSSTSLSGTATNGQNSWTWSTRLRGSKPDLMPPEKR